MPTAIDTVVPCTDEGTANDAAHAPDPIQHTTFWVRDTTQVYRDIAAMAATPLADALGIAASPGPLLPPFQHVAAPAAVSEHP